MLTIAEASDHAQDVSSPIWDGRWDVHEHISIMVVRVNRGAFRKHLEPHQIALTPGGGARLVHTVRLLLELRPDLVWIKMDIANAHNEVSRAAIVRELEAAPDLQHLAQFAAICLAAHHALVAGGKQWREAGQGKA